MSNYSQTTFFTPKDSLPTSDPAKTIFGAAYDVEFGNISTAMSSKADTTSTPSFASLTVTGMITGGGLNVTAATIPANGWYLPSANTLSVATNTVQRGTISSTGNWVINAPTAGTSTLAITAISNTPVAVFNGTDIAVIQVLSTAAASRAAFVFGNSGVVARLGIDGSQNLLSDSTNGDLCLVSAGQSIRFGTAAGSTTRLVLAAAGNITIAAPSSGVALSLTGIANSFTSLIQSSTTAGQGFGVRLQTGTNASDVAFQIRNAINTFNYFFVAGDGGVAIGNTATSRGIGTVTVTSPATVTALQLSPADSVSVALQITDAGVNATTLQLATTNNSASLTISGGTPRLDITANGHTMQLLTDGSLGLSTAPNGPTGIGTINTLGLFVAGNQVFFGAPASANTTAAVSDVGKVINAAGTITIPNAVFSQGHMLSIYNNTAGSITITAGITTMRLAGTATTGSRTLALRGLATIWFESGTECVVSGSGVT